MSVRRTTAGPGLHAVIAAGMAVIALASAGLRVQAQTVEGEARFADAQLGRVLDEVGRGRVDAALDQLGHLLAQYPNFRLAHLVRGDLLLARSRAIEGLGNTGHAGRERLEELKLEALARVRARRERPPQDAIPRFLLRLAPAQKHAVVIDASRFRVYLYENANGTPRLMSDFYGTLGRNGIDKAREGDRKTPVGVYFVTSMIPGRKLPDLYGWGALPISYPNEWDRLTGKTGYGIWLHGVPADSYARAPWASDGCIALANPDIEALASRVEPGTTPVVIAERAEWLAPQEWHAQREAFLRQLDAWRADWESRDTERYLTHYSRGFRSASMNLTAWSAHKRRVNKAKAWIKVRVADLSVLRSPGARDLMVVTFQQDYSSTNFVQQSQKRQYWVMEDNRWKIAYEAPVGRAPVALPESYPRPRRSHTARNPTPRRGPTTPRPRRNLLALQPTRARRGAASASRCAKRCASSRPKSKYAAARLCASSPPANAITWMRRVGESTRNDERKVCAISPVFWKTAGGGPRRRTTHSKMECLDFRRALLAEPARLNAEMARHAAQCLACKASLARSAEWETDLANAFRVPVPERLIYRLLRRATVRRRAIGVLAIALGLLAAVGVLPNLGWTRNDPLALAGIDFVVFDEAQAILYAKPPESGVLSVAAEKLGMARLERLGSVRYVCSLPFGGGMAYHFVLQGSVGKATLMLLPGRPPAKRASASARGLAALVVPAAGGSVTVIARSMQSLERIAQALTPGGHS